MTGRFLVTGGAGYVGSACTAHLLAAGHEVTVLDDLSTGHRDAVPAGAAFVEGFLAGSGTVLVHDHELLGVVDAWVSALGPEAFATAAPLLRRTFGGFEAAERRQLGRLLAHEVVATDPLVDTDLDPARVAAAMITVRDLLGIPR